jgi:hypothetical protein
LRPQSSNYRSAVIQNNQNGGRGFFYNLVIKHKKSLAGHESIVMACSLNIFSCIQDVNRVVSLLADTKPVAENQDEEDNIESQHAGTNCTISFILYDVKLNYVIKICSY